LGTDLYVLVLFGEKGFRHWKVQLIVFYFLDFLVFRVQAGWDLLTHRVQAGWYLLTRWPCAMSRSDFRHCPSPHFRQSGPLLPVVPVFGVFSISAVPGPTGPGEGVGVPAEMTPHTIHWIPAAAQCHFPPGCLGPPATWAGRVRIPRWLTRRIQAPPHCPATPSSCHHILPGALSSQPTSNHHHLRPASHPPKRHRLPPCPTIIPGSPLHLPPNHLSPLPFAHAPTKHLSTTTAFQARSTTPAAFQARSTTPASQARSITSISGP
jgi:hypothetical protein